MFAGPVSGTGTFTGEGEVYLLGSISPGNSFGVLTLENDVVFGNGCVLDMEIGGTPSNAACDRISIEGSAMLAGTVRLIMGPGTRLEVGQSLELLTIQTGWNGSFTLDTGNIGPGFAFDLTYTPTAVHLDVLAVPEPATLSLLALGGPALLRRRRRWRGTGQKSWRGSNSGNTPRR